ncbi:hypothetical protein [Cnuella takakiae]|nr:hypothetical protein [Cnuella takakiae]
MVSAGDAFQKHLEKHHNVSAATPAWLDGSKNQSPSVSAINRQLKELEKEKNQPSVSQPEMIKEQKPEKGKDMKMSM